MEMPRAIFIDWVDKSHCRVICISKKIVSSFNWSNKESGGSWPYQRLWAPSELEAGPRYASSGLDAKGVFAAWWYCLEFEAQVCLAISSGLVTLVHSPFHNFGTGPSRYGSGEEAGMCLWERPPLLGVSRCNSSPIWWHILCRCSHLISSLILWATLFAFSWTIQGVSRKEHWALTIAFARPIKLASRVSEWLALQCAAYSFTARRFSKRADKP